MRHTIKFHDGEKRNWFMPPPIPNRYRHLAILMPDGYQPEAIERLIRNRLGKTQVVTDLKQSDKQQFLDFISTTRVVFVALALIASTWEHTFLRPVLEYMAAIAALAGAAPVYKEALSSLMRRKLTMELSMTLCIIAALLAGKYFVGLLIVLFVLIAEMLESLMIRRVHTAIEALGPLLPVSALVRREEEIWQVPVTELKDGETVIVKPGARIPVDGVVLKGHSFVDQSPVTGETMPIETTMGSQVLAASINRSGILEVSMQRSGGETLFGKFLNAVRQAKKSRAPIERTAENLSSILVFWSLTVAAFTYLLTNDLLVAITVIIVVNAPSVSTGTSLAFLSAIARAARGGIVVRDAGFIEALASVDTVAFDKTGTLTIHHPRVVAVKCFNGASANEVIRWAATAESRSEHQVASAILRWAADADVEPDEPVSFQYHAGKGIVCNVNDGGKESEIAVGTRHFMRERQIDLSALSECNSAVSELIVAHAGQAVGTVEIANVLRPEALDTIAILRGMKLKTMLLTSDTKTIAAEIAKTLSIDVFAAEITPEEKREQVGRLVGVGKKLAMVGDGINDAPALIEATVGIAVGSGLDVPADVADIVLPGNDLRKVAEIIEISRRCMHAIHAAAVGSVAVSGVAMLLSAQGILTPALAAFVHLCSELAVLLTASSSLPNARQE